MMSLRRPDSGFFTYPAFLYFLEQEYFRAYRTGSPMSVAIFQMSVERGMGMRSQRYAMVVDNGVIKGLFVEKPGAFEVSSAENVLKHL